VEIVPIEIKSPGFFWMLQPWKEGKLATIDGWGRFAEISFAKNNRVTIRHLVNFPRRQLDGLFLAWSDVDLLWAETGQMHCIADVRNKKTKAFIPFLSWTYSSNYPVLLDREEGLLLFSYSIVREQAVFRHIHYNYLRDEIVSDTGQDQPLDFLWAIDRERVLTKDFSQSYPYREDKGFIDFYIYNRKTGKIVRNKFTDTVKTLLPRNQNLSEHGAMSWERRYLISGMSGSNETIKLSWNEDFSEVEILPSLKEIVRLQLRDPNILPAFFSLSPGGEWATSQIWPYRGLYNENLNKRAFYHMDNRYPGGMSMPILVEGYERDDVRIHGAFVNHPEHGWCFVKEHNKDKQQYLQIFKMSDVRAEINRQLLGIVNEIR